MKVSLTLIDISEEVGNDKDATTLMFMIESGQILSHVISANSLACDEPASSPSLSDRSCKTKYNNDNNNKDKNASALTRSIHRQVIKYLQTKDKYTSLASVLFKSRAFYEYHGSVDGWSNNNNKDRLPVIDLPRTKHNKPYIPTTKLQTDDDHHDQDGTKYDWRRFFPGGSTTLTSSTLSSISLNEIMFPLSISHQFPFVGIATKGIQSTSESVSENETLWLIGLDIVVFEELNRRLYDSVDEFIDVFYESLSSHEWDRIQSIKNRTGNYPDNTDMNNDSSTSSSAALTALHELYITWALKEAYTKALGVGMGFNFGKLDIVLNFDDNNEDGNKSDTSPSRVSYWELIRKRFQDTAIPQKRYVRASGLIRMHDDNGVITNENNPELWDFFFIPVNSAASSTTSAAAGCTCICIGPSYPSHHESTDDSDSGRHKMTINWETLQSLIDFHEKR